MWHYRGLHVCNLYLSNFQTRGAVELLLLCRATIMQAPVIIHTGFIMIVFMPTGMWFSLFTEEGNQAPLKLSIRTGTLIKRQKLYNVCWVRQKAWGWEHYGAVALSLQLLEAMLQPLTTGSMHWGTQGPTANQLKFQQMGCKTLLPRGIPWIHQVNVVLVVKYVCAIVYMARVNFRWWTCTIVLLLVTELVANLVLNHSTWRRVPY